MIWRRDEFASRGGRWGKEDPVFLRDLTGPGSGTCQIAEEDMVAWTQGVWDRAKKQGQLAPDIFRKVSAIRFRLILALRAQLRVECGDLRSASGGRVSEGSLSCCSCRPNDAATYHIDSSTAYRYAHPDSPPTHTTRKTKKCGTGIIFAGQG